MDLNVVEYMINDKSFEIKMIWNFKGFNKRFECFNEGKFIYRIV